MPIDVGPGIVVGPGISFTVPDIPFTMYAEPGRRGLGFAIKFPAFGPGNLTINWGDGNINSYSSSNFAAANAPSKTYSSNANYTITATGDIFRIFLNEWRPQITGVASWGNLGIQSLTSAFQDCSNLTVVPDTLPNTLTSGNLANMFQWCYTFNSSNVANWDMSNITDTNRMFAEAYVFNQNIANWNTTNVANTSRMFLLASAFSQQIGNWNVSNVTDMSFMFSQARTFNGNIATWDTSKVANMAYMFGPFTSGNTIFNQPIGNWNVSNVSNMEGMFRSQSTFGAFDQDISSWNTSNVTNMRFMMAGQPFNQNIGGWNVSKVTNMQFMFTEARNFNGNIENWDVGNVTNMNQMFAKTTDTGTFAGNMNFNKNIGGWNVSKVTNMAEMFRSSAFNGNIGSWGNKTSNVTSMVNMFNNAQSFNQNLASWCVTNITALPTGFDTGATAWTGGTATRPQWGTCP